MKKEIDENENDAAEEINKRLQDLIDNKKAESEALKKILKAFDRSENKDISTIENIKKIKK